MSNKESQLTIIRNITGSGYTLALGLIAGISSSFACETETGQLGIDYYNNQTASNDFDGSNRLVNYADEHYRVVSSISVINDEINLDMNFLMNAQRFAENQIDIDEDIQKALIEFSALQRRKQPKRAR